MYRENTWIILSLSLDPLNKIRTLKNSLFCSKSSVKWVILWLREMPLQLFIVNLAHYELYQVLLSDEYYLEVFGALECIEKSFIWRSHFHRWPRKDGGEESSITQRIFSELRKFEGDRTNKGSRSVKDDPLEYQTVVFERLCVGSLFGWKNPAVFVSDCEFELCGDFEIYSAFKRRDVCRFRTIKTEETERFENDPWDLPDNEKSWCRKIKRVLINSKLYRWIKWEYMKSLQNSICLRLLKKSWCDQAEQEH